MSTATTRAEVYPSMRQANRAMGTRTWNLRLNDGRHVVWVTVRVAGLGSEVAAHVADDWLWKVRPEVRAFINRPMAK